MNEHLVNICVRPSATIREALQRLAENKPGKTHIPAGIVLVTDSRRKLLGIATDGDLRRALASGADFEIPVGAVMNKTPFVIEGPKSNVEILTLVVDKIRQEHWHKDRLDKIILVDKDRRVLNLVAFYDLWQSSDTRFKHIGVVGLGYVGLTLALALADCGFRVSGYDANPRVMRALRRGKPHFFEEGLPRLLRDHIGRNFDVVDDFSNGRGSDIYIIAVGTPIAENGKPDLRFLEAAARHAGSVLKRGDLVVLRSTIPIGTTRSLVIPALEKRSGLVAGDDFFVAFAPERTVQGKAIEELRKLPQVIGGVNRVSADLAATVFRFLTNSIVMVDSLEEAEMVKLVNNSYRDVTFAFANEASLIAQRWGIDARRVIEAANHGYARGSIPAPSPGVGGYCLEKDPYIFMASARAKRYEPLLIGSARTVSDRMVEAVAQSAVAFLKREKRGVKNPKVFLLGFAFKGKPATSDTRGSTTVALARHLARAGYTNLYGYDPVVAARDIRAHGVTPLRSVREGFRGADAALLMNNHASFEKLDTRTLLGLGRRPFFLLDGWGLLNRQEIKKVPGVEYHEL